MEASDDSLWLLEDGLVRWHREEALANVEDIYFADLPASTAEVASTWTSSRPSLMERMNAEVLTLKVSNILPFLLEKNLLRFFGALDDQL